MGFYWSCLEKNRFYSFLPSSISASTLMFMLPSFIDAETMQKSKNSSLHLSNLCLMVSSAWS